MTDHEIVANDTMPMSDPSADAPAASGPAVDSGDEPPFIGDLQYAIVGRQDYDDEGNPAGPQETFNPPKLAAELKAGDLGFLIDENHPLAQ